MELNQLRQSFLDLMIGFGFRESKEKWYYQTAD